MTILKDFIKSGNYDINYDNLCCIISNYTTSDSVKVNKFLNNHREKEKLETIITAFVLSFITSNCKIPKEINQSLTCD